MIKLIISLVLNIALVYVLNNSFYNLPPLGKIFDPISGIWQNAERESSELVRSHILSYEDSSIVVSYDSNRIPHIKADNEVGLAYAQGWITASERLWQIELQSRASSGQLSEIFGEKLFEYDLLRRRKGINEGAQHLIINMKEQSLHYQAVLAYVKGVNDYIKSLSYKDYPIEYKLMNLIPREYTVEDVAFIALLMMDDMAGTSYAIEATVDYYNLGEDIFNLLFPDRLMESVPVVHNNAIEIDKKSANIIKAKPVVSREDLGIFANADSKEKEEDSIKGSNSWAVSVNNSISKSSVFLANDPHLTLSLPSIWYIVRMECDKFDVFGFSIPGVPFVLIGKNNYIAWGITNGSVCTIGWYKIKFRDSTKDEYLLDGEWKKSIKKLEEIKIKDSPSRIEEVIYTDFGPIVYDEKLPNKFGIVDLAMKWVGHKPNNELYSMLLVNQAKNYEEFASAIRYFDVPILNLSFISKDKNVALEVIGVLPERWVEQCRYIMPGTESIYKWERNVNKDHNPREINPERGFVSSANQRITSADYPYYYIQYSEEKYRNRRVYDLLTKVKNVSVKEMMKYQNDNYNLAAEESMELIKRAIDMSKLTPEELSLFETLVEWNFYSDCEKIGPSIFKEWQNQLLKILWEELYNCKMYPTFHRTITILQTESLYRCLDLKEYRTVDNLVYTAFVRAVKELLLWKEENKKDFSWQNYRDLKIEHTLKIKAFSVYKPGIGGGKGILNANEKSSGVSMRFIVEFGKQANVWISLPGGQSGNPGSFYYDNMLSDWEQGRYLQLTFN